MRSGGRAVADPVSTVLERLEAVKPTGDGRWMARCPAHDDRKPSLSVARGENGRVLLKCFAGCEVGDICAAMGMEARDLCPRDVAATTSAKAQRSRTRSPKRVYRTPEAAAQAISRRVGGKLAGKWVYCNADGSECFRVLRLDLPDGDKTYRPIHPTDRGWLDGDPPGELPLYGQPFPTGLKRVYIVEGEKCVAALVVIGLLATTSAHGAGSAHKTDWTPLAGWEVIIFLDNDAAGRDYAEAVATILTRLDAPATVKIVRLPGLPEGGDVVDWMDALDGKEPDELREALENLAEEAPVYEPEVEVPLDVFRPFPVDALPEPIRSYVNQGAKAVGCDPSFIALPMLSALAAAIGNTRRIALKAGWQEPSVIWSAIVGESGVLKSPALEFGIKPLMEREADAMRRYRDALGAYRVDALRYEVALKEWKAEGCGAGEDPPEQPAEPVPERYVCSDTTVEALAARLDDCPRGLLNARDELAGWLKSFDAYRQGRGGDAEHWLSMHGARPLIIDRKTSGKPVIYVPRAAVSATGSIQPGALRRCLERKHVENGLAARLVFAMPPAKPRRWTEATVDPDVVSGVGEVFDGLLELEFAEDADGEPVPVDLPLSADAKPVWIRFFNEHGEEAMAYTGTDLAAAWSKLEGYAARLGLVVHMVRVVAGDADDGVVDQVSIQAGITLARWSAHEARRVYALLHETEEQGEQRRLIEFIRAKGGRVTARDLQRGGPCCKTAAEAVGCLDALVDGGRGRWETVAPGPKGGKPKDVFVLHGATDTDNTSRGPPI